MQLGYGLYQQQTQKLIMTPELRQAITILQYSAIELTEFLHHEIVENPAFDIEEKEFERYDYLYNSYIRKKPVNFSEDEFNIWETIATPEKTLEEYLLEQARFLSLPKESFEIISYLIGCIDDAGYLNISLAEVAEHYKTEISKIEEVLSILQNFDPVGVGARDLKESLLIQLKNMDPMDTLAIDIVKNHLKDLGERRFNKIATEYKIAVQEVQQVFDYIKTLNPKPAFAFNKGSNKYIIPDVIVDYVEGEFIVIVNDSLVPRLKLNSQYSQYVKEHHNDEATKYITDRINAAKWLMKSIEQRRNTLYRVTTAIVKHQRTFFENHSLKPLTLKEIADEVEVHESTVSRAINQKYVQTPLGTFELKYFFSNGLLTSGGESTSSENVKKRIQDVIDEEEKGKPLSDQKIAEILKEEGIKISRRTVAKYRDELGILSSSQRKRYE